MRSIRLWVIIRLIAGVWRQSLPLEVTPAPKLPQSKQSNTANTRIVGGEIQDSKKISESTASDSCLLQNLKSPADSEAPSGGVYLHRDKNQIARSADLEASSGWGIVKGEGASLLAVAKLQTHTCTFKPLPLNKKENTESKEVLESQKVKAKDSERLESTTCHSEAIAEESISHASKDTSAFSKPQYDNNSDSKTIDCHDFAPAKSRNDKILESQADSESMDCHADKSARNDDSKEVDCHAGLAPARK